MMKLADMADMADMAEKGPDVDGRCGRWLLREGAYSAAEQPQRLPRSHLEGTRAGTVDLQIPKLRRGSYVPEFLEPRRTAAKALAAVIQEGYVHSVSHAQ